MSLFAFLLFFCPEFSFLVYLLNMFFAFRDVRGLPPGMGPVLCEPKLGPGCPETVSVALSVLGALNRVRVGVWVPAYHKLPFPSPRFASLSHLTFSPFPEMLQLQGVGEMAHFDSWSSPPWDNQAVPRSLLIWAVCDNPDGSVDSGARHLQYSHAPTPTPSHPRSEPSPLTAGSSLELQADPPPASADDWLSHAKRHPAIDWLTTHDCACEDTETSVGTAVKGYPRARAWLLPSPGLLPLKMLFTARTPHSKHPATDPDSAHFQRPRTVTPVPPLPTMWFFPAVSCLRDEAWRHGDKNHSHWITWRGIVAPSHPPGGLKEMLQAGGMSTWRWLDSRSPGAHSGLAGPQQDHLPDSHQGLRIWEAEEDNK